MEKNELTLFNGEGNRTYCSKRWNSKNTVVVIQN